MFLVELKTLAAKNVKFFSHLGGGVKNFSLSQVYQKGK
jgi:hypothetical protein